MNTSVIVILSSSGLYTPHSHGWRLAMTAFAKAVVVAKPPISFVLTYSRARSKQSEVSMSLRVIVKYECL